MSSVLSVGYCCAADWSNPLLLYFHGGSAYRTLNVPVGSAFFVNRATRSAFLSAWTILLCSALIVVSPVRSLGLASK